jgi:hypothetical protein
MISMAPTSKPTIKRKLHSIEERLDIVITVDATYNFSEKRKSLKNCAFRPQLKNTRHITRSASEQVIQKKR